MNRPPQMGALRVPGGPLSTTRGPPRADATTVFPLAREPIETAIHGALRGGPGFVDLDGEIRRDHTEFLIAEARKARGTTGDDRRVVRPAGSRTPSTYVRASCPDPRRSVCASDLLGCARVTYHRTARTEVRETSASTAKGDEKYSTKTPVAAT